MVELDAKARCEGFFGARRGCLLFFLVDSLVWRMDCRRVLRQGKGRADISVHVLLQFGSEGDAERVRTGE